MGKFVRTHPDPKVRKERHDLTFQEQHGKDPLIAAERKRDGHLVELYQNLCQRDAVPLDADGSCHVCGRQLATPVAFADLGAPQQAQFKFWLRYRDEHPEQTEKAERELKKLNPNWQPGSERDRRPLSERAKQFFTESVSTGPNGERIVTKKLLEM